MAAVAFAWFLALLYAVATPLGRRIRAVAHWAGRTMSRPGETAPTRELVGRGWHALLYADLWVLPALGALILLLEHVVQVPFLLAAAFGSAFILHRLPVWPREVTWYLARLRSQLEGRASRASPAAGSDRIESLADRVAALEEAYRGRKIPPPSAEVAARAPHGDTDWWARVVGGQG